MNKRVAFFTVVSLVFFINSLFQCYDLGYQSAEHRYREKIWNLENKHTDEIVELLKERNALRHRLEKHDNP